MPGLTPGAEILAFSEGCPKQIVRYTPRVYGFQCHFEFTPEAVKGMIENSTAELEAYKGLPYVENVETLHTHGYTGMNQLLARFLDCFTDTSK
jgi:GMP synthase (glutamine-hydrolysing)